MGLTSLADIRKKLKSLPQTSKAFHDKGFVPLNGKPYIGIEDLQTSMFCVPPKCTGLGFARAALGQARMSLQGDCKVYIILIDMAKWVPRRKQVTQKKRDEQRAKRSHKTDEKAESKSHDLPPYPSGSKLCDEGILEPGPNGSTEFSIPVPVDPTRLAKTRHMRPQVMKFLLEQAKQILGHLRGHYCILDFDEKMGPFVLYNGEIRSLADTHRHGMGEADFSSFFWARQLCDFDVVIRTTDSDTMPIGMHYLATMGELQRGKLFWLSKQEQEKGGYIDLTAMWAGLVKDLAGDESLLWDKTKDKERPLTNMISTAFQFACILGGNDYVFKNLTAHYVSYDNVWKVVMRNKSRLHALKLPYAAFRKRDEEVWQPVEASVHGEIEAKAKQEASLSDARMLVADIIREVLSESSRESVRESDVRMADETEEEEEESKKHNESLGPKQMRVFEDAEVDVVNAVLWNVMYNCPNWRRFGRQSIFDLVF